jgi:pimeloyl-ACP methyl ester carboxylesterase
MRAVLAGLVGLVSLTAGLAFYVPRVLIAGIGGSTYIGAVAAIAGVALIVLALRVALAGRRGRVKLLSIPVLFVAVQWLLVPAVTDGIVTNAPHAKVASAASLGLPGPRDVRFAASDGIRLAGWYVPGSNHAAVILPHGSHGDRSSTLARLALLAYAVLAYDARGHGQSAGVTNALGWGSDPDLRGAITFLRRQAAVDPNRIAALGLSMGGEEALRAAADGLPLRAVIADGAGASTLGDQQLIDHGLTAPIFFSTTWLAMRGTEAVTGESEPPPLNEIVARIRVPVLLIASASTGEVELDRAYQAEIGHHATLWYLSGVSHTQALARYPTAYAKHASNFLNRSLLHDSQARPKATTAEPDGR